MSDEAGKESDSLIQGHRPSDVRGPCYGARHALAVMAFLGFFNVYCLRVNMSVALVAMVNTTGENVTASKSGECVDPRQNMTPQTSESEGEFHWDEKTRGIILGAFFYGYILTQVPGGRLAEIYGGKRVFGIGILSTSALTLLTPLAANLSVYALIALRVLEGIGEGVTYPAMMSMWSNWAPVLERSKLTTFAYTGSAIGTVISMPLSGLLCDYGFAGGWPSVFYVFGSLGCVWFIAWILLVHDSPAEHPRISTEERQYIESSIGPKQKKLKPPWKSIFTSPALLSICFANFTGNWIFYTMLTCLPQYLKDILGYDITQDGFMSAVPYTVSAFAIVLSGRVADFLRSNHYLSTKNARKLMNSIGSFVPPALLICVNYAGCDHVAVIALLTLCLTFGSFTVAGYSINHLDIAPNFAGTLLGISNACGTIPGFLGPYVVGVLTDQQPTRYQWAIVFYIAAAVSVTGGLVFLIFAKGTEQSWNKPADVIGQHVQYDTLSTASAIDSSNVS